MPNRALVVSVLQGDQLLFLTKADAWRSDLAEAGIGNGCHSFSHAFARPIEEEKLSEICVVAGGQRLPKDGSLLANPSDAFIAGSIERLDRYGVAGWVYNTAAPEHAVSISIFFGDRLLDRLDADLFRSDLESANIGAGRHAFRYPFVEEIPEQELSKIFVRVGSVNLMRASPLQPFHASLVGSNPSSEINRIWSQASVFSVLLRPAFEISCNSVIGRVMRLPYKEFPPTADRINPIVSDLCEAVKTNNCDKLHLENVLVSFGDRTKQVEVSRTNTHFISIDRGVREFRRGYEPEIQASIDLFVPDDGVLLDIGSNWGCFSIFLAARPGFSGRIHAFEPSSQSFPNMTKLVDDLNLKDRIVSHNLGLADYSGTARLSVGLLSGLSSISDSVAENYAVTYEDVKIARLDDLSLPKADLIKIDVEGVEASVIRGGERYIRETEPAIIFENWIFFEDLKKTLEPLEILRAWGYAFFLPCWTNSEKSMFSLIPLGEGNSQFFALCPFELDDRTLLDERVNILALPKGRFKSGLLNKPQYQSEAPLSQAATTGTAQRDVSKPELTRLQGENSATLQRIRAEERAALEAQMRAASEEMSILVIEKDSEIAQLHALLSQRDADIVNLHSRHDTEIAKLESLLTRRDAEIAPLQALAEQKDKDISQVHTLLRQRDAAIVDLQIQISGWGTQLAELHALLRQRDSDIARLQALVRERDTDISQLHGLLTQRDADIAHLQALAGQKDADIAQLLAQAAAKDADLVRINASVSNVLASRSWRVTKPLRWASEQIRRLRDS